MALTLKLYPEDKEALTKPCTRVDKDRFKSPELIQFCYELVAAAVEHQGMGLAAPQVGVFDRICVVTVTGCKTPMVNPILIAQTDHFLVTENEGCLSFPGLWVPIPRFYGCTVMWQGPDGIPYTKHVDDIEARCVQHELDHLDGVLLIDRIRSKVKKRLAIDKYMRSRRR